MGIAMPARMRRPWLISALSGVVVLQLAGPHPLADACSVAGPDTPGALLGLRSWTSAGEVPANAAGLDEALGEPFVSGGATLYRIAPGTSVVEAGDAGFTVSAEADTVAPSIHLESAAWEADSACSGCAYGGFDASHVTLDVSAEDDHADAEHITYAVYFGDTEEDAIAASESEPELWVLSSEGRVWFFMAQSELPPFVAVRAFDQAGNASPAQAVMVAR